MLVFSVSTNRESVPVRIPTPQSFARENFQFRMCKLPSHRKYGLVPKIVKDGGETFIDGEYKPPQYSFRRKIRRDTVIYQSLPAWYPWNTPHHVVTDEIRDRDKEYLDRITDLERF